MEKMEPGPLFVEFIVTCSEHLRGYHGNKPHIIAFILREHAVAVWEQFLAGDPPQKCADYLALKNNAGSDE